MGTDFGNEQDISVHDKAVPSMGPTEEAQDVTGLNRIVVGMGAFTDPHNPMTQSGSVNLPLDRHPVTHSDDYGGSVEPGEHVFETGSGEASPMAAGAATLQGDGQDAKSAALPDDRDEWTKANWQTQAKNLNLPTSGNTDAIKQRVEEHEEEQEQVAERGKELHEMSREDLDGLAPDYGLDPADYSRKEDLADAILAAESGQ